MEGKLSKSSKLPNTKGNAFSIAEELLKKLQPEKYKEMKLIEPSKWEYITTMIDFISIQDIVDGIPFTGNGVGIRIDKDTLEIQSYNLNWYKGEIRIQENDHRKRERSL